MAEPDLTLIGEQLRTIQVELREMKFGAEVDRKNVHSSFDALVREVGTAIGTFEVAVTHRLDTLTGQFDQMRAQLGRIEALLQGKAG